MQIKRNIQVSTRLSKRDLLKIGLVVVVLEAILTTPISGKSSESAKRRFQKWINEKFEKQNILEENKEKWLDKYEGGDTQ